MVPDMHQIKNLGECESKFDLDLSNCLKVAKMKQDENIHTSIKYNNQMIKNGSTLMQ